MSGDVRSAGGGNWTFMVRALRYRNYRLFFFGQLSVHYDT